MSRTCILQFIAIAPAIYKIVNEENPLDLRKYIYIYK